MPVRVKGKTFDISIQKTDAWIILETSDPAPHAVVAPVDEEIDRAEQPIPAPVAPEGRKRLKVCGSSERSATLQQTGRERDSWDNRSAREDSRVVAMLKTCEIG